MITTFASESCSRCTIAGAANPGEDRHLNRAEVRAGVRGDRRLRRHRHVDRDAVAGGDAERLQRLGDAHDLARELGERPLAPGAVLAPEDGGGRVRRPLRPRVHARASPCSAARPRTRSSTRSRASRRARGPTGGRARARGRRRPRARTARARRPRRGGALRSRRSRARGRAGPRSRSRAAPAWASRPICASG